MPCGLRGQFEVSSIDPWPQPCTTLPCPSNSITGGAAAQQVAIGGFCWTEVSSSVSVSGKCVTHTCCFESTNTPVTAPRIHLFGISSGHDGSTLNLGGAAVGDCPITRVWRAAATTTLQSSATQWRRQRLDIPDDCRKFPVAVC